PCLPNNTVNNTYAVTLNSTGNTLTLNSSSTPANITVDSVNALAGTLSVATAASLTTTGAYANGASATLQMAGGTVSTGGAMTNAGTITGNGVIAGAGTLTNTGTVTADGGVFDLSGKAISNLSGGTLTGGTWQAGGALA